MTPHWFKDALGRFALASCLPQLPVSNTLLRVEINRVVVAIVAGTTISNNEQLTMVIKTSLLSPALPRPYFWETAHAG